MLSFSHYVYGSGKLLPPAVDGVIKSVAFKCGLLVIEAIDELLA